MSEFKVGDIVEFGGIEGEITSLSFDEEYPLLVKLDNDDGYIIPFTLKGMLDVGHKKPLLNFISRPVKGELK